MTRLQCSAPRRTELQPGIVFATRQAMDHSAIEAVSFEPIRETDTDDRIRIGAECLELNPSKPEEQSILRAWVRRITSRLRG